MRRTSVRQIDVRQRRRLLALAIAGSAVAALVPQAALAEDSCPNALARAQQGAEHLPDCRAYELVSPADKNGYPVGGNQWPGAQLTSSPDGRRITYLGLYPLPGARSGSNSGFFGERLADGWTTAGLLPAPGVNQVANALSGADAYMRGATRDQRFGVYFDNTTLPWGSLWRVGIDGSTKRIADATRQQVNNLAGDAPGQPWFEAISDDGRHVVFGSTSALLPGLAENGNEILYEWVDDGTNAGAGALRVVNRTDDETLTRLDDGDATLGGSPRHFVGGSNPGPLGQRNAISADGERIFFQNPAPTGAGGRNVPQGGGPVYARVGGTETVEVSLPEPGHSPANPPTLYQYLDASHSADDPQVDGRLVFFWANGDLTADAPGDGGIYRYDLEAEELSFLTAAYGEAGPGTPPQAMASEDGRRLYFQHGDGQAPGEGVKLVDEDTVVSVLDGHVVTGAGAPVGETAFEITRGLRENQCAASANVSPDGRYLAFSAQPGADPFALQTFRYDADRRELADVSPSAAERPGRLPAGFVGTSCAPAGSYNSRAEGARVMSDDGEYVFFGTADALDPRDVDGTFDVYQWHDGERSLISSGNDPSWFDFLLGTDATGTNVFFAAADRLVAADPDAVYDIYSARIGGGTAAGAPVSCDGDDCQLDAPRWIPRRAPATDVRRGADDPPTRATLQLGRLSATQRRVLAAGRSVALDVRVDRPGRLLVTGRARVKGVPRTVIRTSRTVRRAGVVRVRLALSNAARRQLVVRRRLAVALRVSFDGARREQRLSLRRSR